MRFQHKAQATKDPVDAMWGNFGKGRGKGYGGYGKGKKGWASSSWDTTYNHDSAGKGKGQSARRQTGDRAGQRTKGNAKSTDFPEITCPDSRDATPCARHSSDPSPTTKEVPSTAMQQALSDCTGQGQLAPSPGQAQFRADSPSCRGHLDHFGVCEGIEVHARHVHGEQRSDDSLKSLENLLKSRKGRALQDTCDTLTKECSGNVPQDKLAEAVQGWLALFRENKTLLSTELPKVAIAASSLYLGSLQTLEAVTMCNALTNWSQKVPVTSKRQPCSVRLF